MVEKVICEAKDGCPDNKPETGVICPHAIPHIPVNYSDEGISHLKSCMDLWRCRTAKNHIRCIPIKKKGE